MAMAKRGAGELAVQAPFEYAPAPEATDHVRIAEEHDLFIGGRFVPQRVEARIEEDGRRQMCQIICEQGRQTPIVP